MFGRILVTLTLALNNAKARNSGVDSEAARGAVAPSIKIYQGESTFSPPQSFSLFFFIFQCTVNGCLLLQQEYAYRARQPEAVA